MKIPDHEIKTRVGDGRLGIEPFEATQVQPASYDVRLADQWRTEHGMSFVKDEIELVAGACILGITIEHFRLPNDLVGELAGKSSIGRMFISVHQTAGFIDPTFEGTLTLEIKNVGSLPRTLKAGQLIGQVSFTQLTSPCTQQYRDTGHYYGQVEPTPSYMDRSEVPADGVLASQPTDGHAGLQATPD